MLWFTCFIYFKRKIAVNFDFNFYYLRINKDDENNNNNNNNNYNNYNNY